MVAAGLPALGLCPAVSGVGLAVVGVGLTMLGKGFAVIGTDSAVVGAGRTVCTGGLAPGDVSLTVRAVGLPVGRGLATHRMGGGVSGAVGVTVDAVVAVIRLRVTGALVDTRGSVVLDARANGPVGVGSRVVRGRVVSGRGKSCSTRDNREAESGYDGSHQRECAAHAVPLFGEG
jgi:hypothetical protein